MKLFFKTSISVISAVLLAAVFFCAKASAQALQINRLAVMPLATGMPPQAKELLDSKETELAAQGQPVTPGAAAVVTGCLQQALEKELPGRVAAQNETAGAEELLAYMKKTATLKVHALKLAANVQASHVMAGSVWRYRELKGTAYGADRPASVAFSVYVLDAATGAVVWSGVFDKTQQSLSENLLDAPAFLQHGAKWLTAEELTGWGVEDMVQKLKALKSGAVRTGAGVQLSVGK